MSRITAYEASDGTLHRDKKLFLTHEQNLQAIPKIRGHIDAKTAASDGTPEGDAARDASIDSQVKILTETIGLSTLRDILNEKFVQTGADAEDNPAPAAPSAPEAAAGQAPAGAEI